MKKWRVWGFKSGVRSIISWKRRATHRLPRIEESVRNPAKILEKRLPHIGPEAALGSNSQQRLAPQPRQLGSNPRPDSNNFRTLLRIGHQKPQRTHVFRVQTLYSSHLWSLSLAIHRECFSPIYSHHPESPSSRTREPQEHTEGVYSENTIGLDVPVPSWDDPCDFGRSTNVKTLDDAIDYWFPYEKAIVKLNLLSLFFVVFCFCFLTSVFPSNLIVLKYIDQTSIR